ncbi:MAG TPA: metal-dependent hydrolase, partial [Nitrosopumilaceae archaeon]|nr:metal-dependent hydrolase [Nitrosopumilaceae archaeon]
SALTAVEWLIFIVAGALFPDIDIKSKGQKYFYYLVLLLFIIFAAQQRYEIVACFSFIVISPMLVHHRGVFHNPLFIIVISLLAWGIISAIIPQVSYQLFLCALFFIAGSFSHIWLDLGTRQTMRRLLPQKRRKRW